MSDSDNELVQTTDLSIEPLSDQDLDAAAGGLAAATDAHHCTEGCISFGDTCTNQCTIKTEE